MQHNHHFLKFFYQLCQNYFNYRIIFKQQIYHARVKHLVASLCMFEASVQSSAGSCDTYGKQACNGICFFRNTLGFSSQYHSNNDRRLEKLSQWQNLIKCSQADNHIRWNKHINTSATNALFTYPHRMRLILGYKPITGDCGQNQTRCAWPRFSLNKSYICFSTDCHVWLSMMPLTLLSSNYVPTTKRDGVLSSADVGSPCRKRYGIHSMTIKARHSIHWTPLTNTMRTWPNMSPPLCGGQDRSGVESYQSPDDGLRVLTPKYHCIWHNWCSYQSKNMPQLIHTHIAFV
jgi:hypothetical protein